MVAVLNRPSGISNGCFAIANDSVVSCCSVVSVLLCHQLLAALYGEAATPENMARERHQQRQGQCSRHDCPSSHDPVCLGDAGPHTCLVSHMSLLVDPCFSAADDVLAG